MPYKQRQPEGNRSEVNAWIISVRKGYGSAREENI